MNVNDPALSPNEETVVAHYRSTASERPDAYQSEAELEETFIQTLVEQGYERAVVHNSDALVANLRKQLELLNNYRCTDKEWAAFFKNKIADANEGVVEKTRKIQEDSVQNLTREDGTTINITLIDKKYPQQPPAGDQSVRRKRRNSRFPLRRDDFGQRSSAGSRGAKAPRRRD